MRNQGPLAFRRSRSIPERSEGWAGGEVLTCNRSATETGKATPGELDSYR